MLSPMNQVRRYDIFVEGSTVGVREAGPSRAAETVVIVGASDDLAVSLLTRLGRIVRAVAVDKLSSAMLDELKLRKPHLILVSNGTDVDDIVGLLQRTITID